MSSPALRICCVLTVLCFLCALLSANGRAGLFGDPLDGVSTVLAEEERSHEDERPTGKEGGEDTYGTHFLHGHALAASDPDAAAFRDGRSWRVLAGVRPPLLRPPLA